MTDQQWLELLAHKSSDELSFEELEQLAAQMRESPELRAALAEHLEMEQCLAAAMGRVDLSADQLVVKARERSSTSRWMWWGLGACVVLLAATGTYLAAVWKQSELPRDGALVADANPNNGDSAQKAADDENPASDPAGMTGAPPIVEPLGPLASAGPIPDAAAADASFKRTIEAESMTEGNVSIDNTFYGAGIGVVSALDRSGGTYFAEYVFDLPKAGLYQLEARYAASVASPLSLIINGTTLTNVALSERTGGWMPDSQKNFVEGVFEFQNGRNVVRFEATSTDPNNGPRAGRRGGPVTRRDATFPHLDKFIITEVRDPKARATALAAKEQPPWTNETNLGLAPRTMQQIALDGFPNSITFPISREVGQWFSQYVAISRSGTARGISRATMTTLTGTFPLRSPWAENTVLRIALSSPDHWRLHFWRGTQGVTVQLYDRPSFGSDKTSLAAYATTRVGTGPLPSSYRWLISTDDDRLWRTKASFTLSFDVRIAGGWLTFSRGDILLLQVPFEGLPTAVNWDGDASLRGISLVRTSSPPPELRAARPLAAEMARPTDALWETALPDGSAFKPLDGGGIELSSTALRQAAWAMAPLPKTGLLEYIVQVKDATPGARVFFADDKGQPIFSAGFFRAPRDDGMTVGLLGPSEDRWQTDDDHDNTIVPLVKPSTWLKVVYACGSAKLWASEDGKVWARASTPISKLTGAIAQIGVQVSGPTGGRGAPAGAHGKISLTRVELRDLAALAAIVPAEVIKQAPLLNVSDPAQWWRDVVAKQRPEAVAAEDWLRACVLKQITHGGARPLTHNLVYWLSEDTLNRTRELTVAARLQILDELCLLVDAYDEEQAGRKMVGYFIQLGRQLSRDGEPRPFSTVAPALMACSLWTKDSGSVLPDALVRDELIALCLNARAEDALALCNQLRLFNSSERLIDWAEATAVRQLGRSEIRLNNPERAHPLVDEVTKEGFNVLAEFDAALAADAFTDACQMIAAVGAKEGLGILADSRDKRLYHTLPGAVTSALHEHPEMRKSMMELFGAVADLRWRQALASGDASAIEAVARLYPATEAAAEAHAWLGDRALAANDLTAASIQFHAADSSASPGLSSQLPPRQRLVAALLGRSEGRPVDVDVALSDTRLAPRSFEDLVQSVRTERRAARGETVAGVYAAPWQLAPQPSAFTSVKHATWDGLVGTGTENVPSELRRNIAVNWVARQMAQCVVGDTLLTNNRYDITAYDLKTGKLRWRATLKEDAGRTHRYSLVPMQPLVIRDMVVARVLTKSGTALVAVRLDSGKPVWGIHAIAGIASDPVVMDDELVALAAQAKDQQWNISIVRLDPMTGEVRKRLPVATLRINGPSYIDSDYANSMLESAAGQLTVADGLVFATFGGVVAACDRLDGLQWVRRQEWIPTSDDEDWVRQYQQPPLFAGGRLYVQQPGVKAVDALDPQSGRIIWRKVLLGVQRIIGLANDRLVVETSAGLLGLAADTGEIKWTYASKDPLGGALFGGPGGLCIAQLERKSGTSSLVRRTLVWIDPATGTETLRAPFEDWRSGKPQLGPIVRFGDKVWVWGGEREDDVKVGLYELSFSGRPGG